MNYATLLKKDNGLFNTHAIKTVMLCRGTWSEVASCSRASTGWGEWQLELVGGGVLQSLLVAISASGGRGVAKSVSDNLC